MIGHPYPYLVTKLGPLWQFPFMTARWQQARSRRP
jgi:hypothetical protein